MILKHLIMQNFRNYRCLEQDWHEGINMIYGSNAQGKTNILEAIYFLSGFSSFRKAGKEEMIQTGSDYFFLSGDYEKGGLNHTMKAAYSLKKKAILKSDGNIKHRLSDVIGELNAVMFSPDDLMMMKGNPEERRSFLDKEIIQMSPESYTYFQRYQKVLRQRNNVLKEMREGQKNDSLLEVFDVQAAEYGSYILEKRREALDRLLPLTRLAHRKITSGKEELLLEYVGGFLGEDPDFSKKTPVEQWKQIYLDILKNRRKKDIQRGSTTFGPHRDDILFSINGASLKNFGSQGQQRTATLALKIGELELMKGQRGEYPLFLLDDVFSELDQERREALIHVVNQKVQTFITGTKRQEFPCSSQYFEVKEGRLEKK